MSVGRVGDHAGGLIYYGVVLVFENDADIGRGSKGSGVILVLEKESVAGLDRVFDSGMNTIKFHCSVELYALDPCGAHLEFAPHDLLYFAAVIFTLNKINYFHCYILTNY